jgi:hypothetical protein
MWALLLKLVPSKAYVIGFGFFLLGCGILYERVHLIDEGEAKVTAADKRTALVALAKDKTIESLAQAQETQSAEVYKQVVSIPDVGDIGVVCVRHAPASSKLPAPTGGPVPGVTVATDSGSGLAYDPTGAALTRGRDADAQITKLQARISELETMMKDAP